MLNLEGGFYIRFTLISIVSMCLNNGSSNKEKGRCLAAKNGQIAVSNSTIALKLLFDEMVTKEDWWKDFFFFSALWKTAKILVLHPSLLFEAVTCISCAERKDIAVKRLLTIEVFLRWIYTGLGTWLVFTLKKFAAMISLTSIDILRPASERLWCHLLSFTTCDGDIHTPLIT